MCGFELDDVIAGLMGSRTVTESESESESGIGSDMMMKSRVPVSYFGLWSPENSAVSINTDADAEELTARRAEAEMAVAICHEVMQEAISIWPLSRSDNAHAQVY